MTPDEYRRRQEAREQMEPEQRKVKALEEIADRLGSIQHSLHLLQASAKVIADRR